MAAPGSFLAGGRRIGAGEPCFVIAEAGVNHDGDLEQAKRLVEAAHEAGADAVKFQTWRTDELVVPDAELAVYQREHVGDVGDQGAMLRELELSYDDFRALKRHADEVGILFLSTPDEPRSLAFLVELGVPCLKVGSPEVTNTPYLRAIGATGLPAILSTGMSTLEEVARAVATLEQAGTSALVLLQCTSSYPTDAADANLRAMDTLAETFGRPVGYSDHTLGVDVAIAAVARGACVLEKHLTLDRTLRGPDHSASLEPSELAGLVQAVRRVEAALGDGVKRVLEVEIDARRTMQKVAVAARPLEAGRRLEPDDVVLRRSGSGLPVGELEAALGRPLRRAVAAGEPLTEDALG